MKKIIIIIGALCVLGFGNISFADYHEEGEKSPVLKGLKAEAAQMVDNNAKMVQVIVDTTVPKHRI